MLTAVPQAVTSAARQVVLRHPNSMPCTVWRKRVVRVERDPETGEPSEMGGAPTLGGMGVLRAEDEDDFEYDELGEGRCLFVGPWVPTDMNDRKDAPAPQQMQEAQVEPIEAGAFEVGTGDLVMLDLGLAVIMGYECVSITGAVNIPPYVRRLVLNPRDDLHHLEPFIPDEAG